MSGPRVKPVEFQDSFGNRLGGFLHLPSGDRSATGVVLVVSGVKDRVGPHRIQVELARAMALHGHPVLRYDPCGIGESDGAFGNHRTSRHFAWIQKGLFGDSIRHAVSFMDAEVRVKRVVLGGLCGGATAAVLTEGLAGVAGYVLIAPSAIFDSAEFEAGLVRGMTRGRLIDRDSAMHLARHAYHSVKKKARFLSVRHAESRKVLEANVNFYFVERFRAIAQGSKPVLCVVIDDDPTCREFEAFALRKHRAANMTIHRVNGVSHELASADVVGETSDRIISWLEDGFGGRPRLQ